MATIAPNTPSSPTPQGGSNVATNVPASRRRSGAFTNLQSYIRANRDTTREQAESVAEDIEKRGQQALGDIQSEAQKATAAAQTTGPQIEEADIQSQIQSIRPTQETRGASTNIEPLANQARQTVTALRDANPNQVQADFSDAANRARSAERDARMLGTTEGIQTLLGQGQRPGATRGEGRLDTLLLQSIPEFRQRFSQVQQGLIGATDPALQQGTTSVNQAIEDRQARLNALRQFADEQLAQEISSAYDMLEQRRPELAQQVRDRSAQLAKQFDSYNNAMFKALPSRFGAINPSKFLSGAGVKTANQLLLEAAGDPLQRVQNLSTQELLSPEQAARLNALYGLRGDLGQAGEDFTAQQYTAAPVSIDNLMFQGDLPNIGGRVEGEINQAITNFNNELGSAVQSYQAAIPNPSAANEAISKIQSGNARMRSSQWKALQEKMSTLEQSLPSINSTLKKYGLNPIGNNFNEVLRRFGYKGPLRNSPKEYTNPNDPAFRQPRDRFGMAATGYSANTINLADTLARIDSELSAGLGTSGNLPDAFVPVAPATTPQHGQIIDNIPGVGPTRVFF